MANLEIKGKVIANLGAVTYGQGKEKLDFVIETDGQYPKKVNFTVYAEKLLGFAKTLKVGSVVTVSFNPESREYNGKWYTSLSAWKIDLDKGINPNNPIQNSPEDKVSTPTEEEDTLPF